MSGPVVERSSQETQSKAELMKELYRAYGREPKLHLPEPMIAPTHETLITLRESFVESNREIEKYERVKETILEGIPRMASEFGDDINAYKNTLRRIAVIAKWMDVLTDGQRLEAFGHALRNEKSFTNFVMKAASKDMADVILRGLYGARHSEFEQRAQDVQPGTGFSEQADAFAELKPEMLESLGSMLTHALNSPRIGVKVRVAFLAQLGVMVKSFKEDMERYGKVMKEIEIAAPELEAKHDYEITEAISTIVNTVKIAVE